MSVHCMQNVSLPETLARLCGALGNTRQKTICIGKNPPCRVCALPAAACRLWHVAPPAQSQRPSAAALP